MRTSIGDLSETTRKRLTLAACILGSAIVFVDSSVVTVALPAMARDLGGGLALQQWVADAYLLTLGSLILVGGSLGDLFGQKRVFVIGVVAFAVTSVLCAVAWDEGSLIVARAAQGVAGALLTPASLATISVLFEGEERGAAIGTWTAYTGIAFLIGPLIGGWLVSAVSWRGIFLINVPIAIATLALIAIAIPPIAGRADAHVDVVGGALCALGLAGPVFALIEAPITRLLRPADPGHPARRHRALRALPRLGGAELPPDAAAPPLPPPELLLREPRDVHRLRRAHDPELLPDAVPAADRRVLAVPERPRDRAHHDRPVLSLAARRAPVDALRAAFLHGRRAH